MKLRQQTKYFINGTILLFLAIFCVTFLPGFLVKLNFSCFHGAFFYRHLEFFLLCACCAFYLFSPKYYKYQILSILAAMGLFALYIK